MRDLSVSKIVTRVLAEDALYMLFNFTRLTVCTSFYYAWCLLEGQNIVELTELGCLKKSFHPVSDCTYRNIFTCIYTSVHCSK